jgi:predicted XRE-type DNA-binding protein
MKGLNIHMKPQDILLLLKLIILDDVTWKQKYVAEALGMSQSEVSESVARSKYSGLLDPKGKKVMKLAFIDFLQFGLKYVFPQKPGPVVRGIPTSHSAAPLRDQIKSSENYVWPSGKGMLRGQSIIPLYSSAPEAALKDSILHGLLALVDALRIGRAREREIAINELKRLI